MAEQSRDLLRRLGEGESIAAACRMTGLDPAAFPAWWRRECQRRVPPVSGRARAPLGSSVEIVRDRWGVPHVMAESNEDLFVGFGYAMAQDRLFQLDYLRRKGAGRLAEILGASALESDVLVRTVGLRRIAEAEWQRLDPEVRNLVEAFTRGVNALIEECQDRLPIEFDLLGYRPEPWTPVDCITIENEFRWYLTGRFPVIVIPELVKRALGEGKLYRAFLSRESDEESIIPPGSYPAGRCGNQPVGRAVSDPDAAVGSNNWVVSGERALGALPLVASDPHIAFEAVSCWYEVHLCGGSFNVAGMSYVGMPAVMFGRNERVAWGCTNNICSLRDLYQEKTDPAHKGYFLTPQGRWEKERTVGELIRVRGSTSIQKIVRYSHNGPIVDEVIPPPAGDTGPVSLKWLGAYEGGWLTALLGMNRAGNCDEFREALRPWHVPTFCVVFGDVEGHIGFQATGRIPIREVWERGYRLGWEPDHQWEGLVPFEGMPRLADPDRGWICTSNNRPAPEDFPNPLSGTWSDDLRSRRIREMIEGREKHSVESFGGMHQDALSLRAVDLRPKFVAAFSGCRDPKMREAVALVEAWDGRLEVDRAGATIFEVFYQHWQKCVVSEHFQGDIAELVSMGGAGIAARMLSGDDVGWFAPGNRVKTLERSLSLTLSELSARFGPDMTSWTWGRLHTIPLRHVLSSRGELPQLLDRGGFPVRGGLTTVCNVSPGPDWKAKIGAGYRMIADLASSPPELWAIDVGSVSGHVGSPHYDDQPKEWARGAYHVIPLAKEEVQKIATERLRLEADKA